MKIGLINKEEILGILQDSGFVLEGEKQIPHAGLLLAKEMAAQGYSIDVSNLYREMMNEQSRGEV